MNPHHGQSGYPHQQSNMDMYPQEGEMDEDMSDSGSGSSSHGKTSQAGPSKRKGRSCFTAQASLLHGKLYPELMK
jgi:hypothetical protein